VGFAQGSKEASVLYSSPDTGCLLVEAFSTSNVIKAVWSAKKAAIIIGSPIANRSGLD
jgi:hypothetical protein